ncbi:MAG: N-acetylmuramoyl-L-alanine amidase [Oscillospiraceae bacterium]|nr:N-acetylmuramoyl-L-alanine amidase [Oscillospiraceae bacterium]
MFRNRKSIRFRVIFWTLLVLISLLIFRSCCSSLIDDCDSSNLISKKMTIIVDPGHGGFDGGADGLFGIVEKDINLAIGVKLKEMLCAFGFDVVIIRDSDVSLEDDCSRSLSERKTSDMKNRLKFCDNFDNPVFISIHQNKFYQASCSGTQIFYGRHNNKSKLLAQKLQNNFKNDINKNNNREIKKGEKNLFLLYNARCPIVLIECGFISNPSEAQLLISEDYQSKICFVIIKSLIEFVESGSLKDNSLSTFFRFKI